MNGFFDFVRDRLAERWAFLRKHKFLLLLAVLWLLISVILGLLAARQGIDEGFWEPMHQEEDE